MVFSLFSGALENKVFSVKVRQLKFFNCLQDLILCETLILKCGFIGIIFLLDTLITVSVQHKVSL